MSKSSRISARRRSPSLRIASSVPFSFTNKTVPSFPCVITSIACFRLALRLATGKFLLCITSFTLTKSRLPRLPPGWKFAKSSLPNLRCLIKQIANASPKPSVSVVETVGAAPNGQASLTIFRLMNSSQTLPSELFLSRAIAMIFTPKRLRCGRILTNSSLSPLKLIASTMSSLPIIPRSPCSASVGWTKNDGVPVLSPFSSHSGLSSA